MQAHILSAAPKGDMYMHGQVPSSKKSLSFEEFISKKDLDSPDTLSRISNLAAANEWIKNNPDKEASLLILSSEKQGPFAIPQLKNGRLVDLETGNFITRQQLEKNLGSDFLLDGKQYLKPEQVEMILNISTIHANAEPFSAQIEQKPLTREQAIINMAHFY